MTPSLPPAAEPHAGLGLPELLLLATRAVFERTHDELAERGVTVRPAHGYTFQLLASTGGASGAEVALHLGVTKQAAAQLLDGLERVGFVERRADPRDHRARLAVLTPAGWRVVQAASEVWVQVEGEVRDLLGAERFEALSHDLRRVAEHGGTLEPPLRLRPVW
jgi:DNA-binding MarR family transcriptional regulator